MRLPACLLWLSLLLTACHDDVIPDPPPAIPAAPRPMATFAADPEGAAAGIRITPVEILGPDRVLFAMETTWLTDHLTESHLLLKIDSGARSEINLRPGDWSCGGGVGWYITARPGEWLLERSPWPNDCTCLPEDHVPENFDLALLEVWIREPGTWRIALSPASPTPVCDCEDGCLTTEIGLYGGTVHVAAP